ncbi:MAG: dynamin family protein [Candidatus Promineofilum sp.]|nr:dynamin family protein [Promineifilum sp.]MBP9658035.1 dynamin family protein [Promineifilum sp.]
MTKAQEALLKETRDALGRLRDVLAAGGTDPAGRAALAESIRQLDELFLLVIAGEFNAGKSAFINALLGQKLQPEGVTPTTDQIYLLRYGETSQRMPGENGVWIQTAPVKLLSKLTVVDTPGTNAIVREHEALTSEFIPRSDLVLFITSADRPFTESERAFLDQIRNWGKKIVLVINKIDIFDNEAELSQVINFVGEAARSLVGDVAAVFPVSARLAQAAKSGQPDKWAASRFEPLESYIRDTLDDEGRFRLKLLNPLGVGGRLIREQLDGLNADLATLAEDSSLLDDVRGQMTYYDEDMQRNFKARIAEIDSLLYAMERRGNDFFEDRLRLGRIPDLLRSKQLEQDFQDEVVADTPRQIEDRVNELVDWMVQQDLRQWTAVADHLGRRRDAYQGRIVGDSPREGTLAWDRGRLIDSIGRSTRQAVESYDQTREAAELAASARQAVVNAGLAGVGASIGVIIAVVAHTAFLDFTGIFAGVAAAALGLLVLPARKRKAKKEFSEKLDDLRRRLVDNLQQQFEREMRNSAQRIEDTIAPFDRFVRSERDRLTTRQQSLQGLSATVSDLTRRLG